MFFIIFKTGPGRQQIHLSAFEPRLDFILAEAYAKNPDSGNNVVGKGRACSWPC